MMIIQGYAILQKTVMMLERLIEHRGMMLAHEQEQPCHCL